MLIAAVFVLVFASILTLSPAVRERSWNVEFLWYHWVGVGIWFGVFFLANKISARRLPNRDPYLLPTSALLTGWGLMAVWRLYPELGIRQSIWVLIAASIFILGLRLPASLNFLRRYKYLWLTSIIGITALTLLLGTNPMGYGPRMWLGCCGFYLQPSEPLKLLLVVYLAAYLADIYPLLRSSRISQDEKLNLSRDISTHGDGFGSAPILSLMPLLAPTLLIMGLILVLLVIQRDFGTVLILYFIYSGILYISTGQKKILVITLVGLVLAFTAGYFLIDVVQQRVDTWANPWIDPSNSAYQIVQSLISIANGGIPGRGPGLGYPGLVPISHSDFIFSTISEETGLLGAAGLLLLIGIFCVRAMGIAMKASNPFKSYLAAGLTIMLAVQSLVIIAGNMRMLPLTGITLPFISYGGSSLITTYLSLLFLVIISAPFERKNLQRLPSEPFLNMGIFILVGIGLAVLAAGWWTVYRSPNLISRTDNPRRAINDLSVLRGSILDRNNQPINITTGHAGEYSRSTRYPPLSNIVGYTHPRYGQSGLETSMDGYLRGWLGNPAVTVWWHRLLYGQPPPGWDIRLSIDLDLQRFVDQQLEGLKGSLVLLNARTGEVLAISSHPTFDSNSLDETWDQLMHDPDAALVNRAAMGIYDPGPIMNPFLIAGASASDGISKFETQEITGYDNHLSINGYMLECAQDPQDQSFSAAVQAGCPEPAFELGKLLGPDKTVELIQMLGFSSPPNIRLESSGKALDEQSFSPEKSVLGSGLQISPLQLAHAGSVLSNAGTMPPLSLVTAVKSPEEAWTILEPLGTSSSIFNAETALDTKNYFAVEGLPIWQTTALSPPIIGDENSKEGTWYLAGTLPDTDGTPLVLALHLEEKNPELAVEIGRAVLGKSINQIY